MTGNQLVSDQKARYKAGEELFNSSENLYCRFSTHLYYARLSGTWWQKNTSVNLQAIWKKAWFGGYDLDNIRVWADTMITRLTIITPQELSEVVASQLLQ